METKTWPAEDGASTINGILAWFSGCGASVPAATPKFDPPVAEEPASMTEFLPRVVATAPTAVASPSPAVSSTSYDELKACKKQLRREWHQSGTFVFITIFQSGVDKDSVRSETTQKRFSLDMKIPKLDDKYSLCLELYDAVIPEASKVQVSKAKIDVELTKKFAGFHWKYLEKEASTVPVTSPAPSTVPDAPKGPTAYDIVQISALGGSGVTTRRVRREWHQNKTDVFITIFIKGMTKDTVTQMLQTRELTLDMQLPSGEADRYFLHLDLFDDVDPEKSEVSISKSKVDVQLAKRSIGMQWVDLEAPLIQPESEPEDAL